MSYRRNPESTFVSLAVGTPSRKRVIAPVSFEWTDREDAIRDVIAAVNSKSCRVFAFCNMHTFNLARRSSDLAQALAKTTVYNDGLGIDIASRILFGTKFPENLNGTDFTPALLERFGRPVSVYLVGSAPGVAENAAQALSVRFPLVTIVGCQHGFFDDSQNSKIADSIRAANTDLVLVGMGNPRQELWATNISEQSGAVVLCVGAYIDFTAGRFARAPEWVRRSRCEWAYRLALEPARMWRRYFGGAPPFLFAVLKEKLKNCLGQFERSQPVLPTLPLARYSRRQIAIIGLSCAAALMRKSLAAAEPGSSRVVQQLPFLRGVNFAGLTHEAWSQPPAPPAYDYYLRQKKMNVVRLNFPWEWIQPRMQAPLDPERCRVVDAQICRAASAGAYVILEFHNFGRRTVDGVAHIIGESAACTMADFADAWARMAQGWGGNERVILGLMNEPHDQSTEVLLAVSNAAIAAIRRTGAKGLVMVSGNDWNSVAWSKGSDNQKWMLHIKDEANNFCFDVHHYFDDWSAGQTPNVRENSLASMQSFTAWAKAHRMQAFCGEFGCGVNKRGVDACRDLLAHMEANKDVFIGWAWWGAGGPWQPDYVFLLDPYASVTSPTNPDPVGARTWAAPVDRPQMKLLQEFLPKDATPFNAWLIETHLASKIGAFYRKGDYREASKACFFRGCESEWLDSGPRRIPARASPAGAPGSQRDGSVRFAARAQPLAITLPPGDRIVGVYATVKTAKSEASARRYLVAGLPSGNQRADALALDNADSRSVVGDRVQLLEATRRPTGAPAAPRPMATGAGPQTMASLDWIEGRSQPGQTTIGAAGRNGTEGLDGDVFDLLILREGVTQEEHARIEGRLLWDLGLAHTLPSSHPYRLRAPSLPAR